MKNLIYLSLFLAFNSVGQSSTIIDPSDNNGILSKNATTVISSPNSTTLPTLGAGTRLIWTPHASAFRAGTVDGTQWDGVKLGTWSFATGHNTEASGQSSTSIGLGNVSSGIAAVSFGSSNISSGDYSTSFGLSTKAVGVTATSMGFETIANGLISTSMGNKTSAEGVASISMGNRTRASGNNATSMGHNTSASGLNATSMGYQTSATNISTTSMGENSLANGRVATCIGSYLVANAAYSTILGRYNVISGDLESYVSTDPLFVVGNGMTETSRNNALTLLKNGNLGLDVDYPEQILDINGRMRVRHNGISSGIWMSNSANSLLFSDGSFFGNKTDTEAGIFIGGAWNFAVNNLGNATLLGNLCAANVSCPSDYKFKKNIKPLENSLSNILQINGVSYVWRKNEFPEHNFSNQTQIGFIAQDIEKIFPEMVFTNENGYKSVDYGRLTPVLVEAIKEQQKQIENLESKNKKLENRLDKIEAILHK
jgi:hypothetical protein